MRYAIVLLSGLILPLYGVYLAFSGVSIEVPVALFMILTLPGSWLTAWGMWIYSRHQVDPSGTHRRVRNSFWAVFLAWGAAKIIG